MNPGTLGAFFGRVAAGAARRAWLVLVVGLLLAASAAAVIAITGMKVQPVNDAIFDRDSAAYIDTAEAEKAFGTDPVVILVKGDLIESLKAENLERLNVLEQCVAGDITRGRGKLFEICDRIAEIDPVQVAAGPATFLTRAVTGITGVYQQQLKQIQALPEGSARAEEGQQQLLSLAAGIVARYGLTSLPSLDDSNFINKVVYGDGNIKRGPKPKLSYLFPNADSAQIVLRLRSDLTDDERSETIDLIRQATEDQSTQLAGAEYVITGSPVIFDSLSESLQTGVALLAVVALVLMSIALALIFGSAWRLLPLGLAIGAITIAFGLLRVAGGSISLAALGAVPILIGLTVDYAVQIQARYDEADHDLSPPEAARIAASLGLPMIATACVASAFGFAALLVSPVPLISEFGLLLASGVLVCLLVVFIFGFAALSIRGPGRSARIPFERFSGFGFVKSGAKSILGMAMLAPGRLLAVSLLVAACGWAVGTQAETRTELREILPTRTEAVQDFIDLEDSTGTSGVVDMVVRSDDVTDPEVVAWMTGVRRDVLAKAGYAAVNPNCVDAELCPGPAITDFVPDGGQGLNAADVRQILRGLPRTERAAMIGGGLAGKALPTETKIPFVIRAGSVDRQTEVIDSIETSIDESRGGKGPPAGTTVELAGLPVVITATVADLADSRYLLTGLAILAVGLVLLLIYRSFTRMLVPLVPIVVAGGWSAVIISSLDISLNPFSTVLAVLVTAIATEFSVILAGRYFQERETGLGMADALRSTYGRTGMAIAASGVTAIAGFAALAASDIGMLREFGLVAVVDLSVALLGVAIVLPAVLAWLERR
ncbi:MAG: efflux RND transporter permease subunit [Solirubrobacterales bacterium]